MARWFSRYLSTARLLRWSVLCSLIAVGNLMSAMAFQQNIIEIKPGAAIERELSGGETQSFRLHLISGQFLYLVLDQRGIDVALTLFAPDGRQLSSVDSPNGDYGPEPIVVVAEAAGDYRLDVTSPDKKAAAGRYEIKILALREATALDRNHVAAERTFEEAQKLNSQRTPAARRAAIEKYRQALPFFQSSGDRYRQAIVLNRIGIVYARSGEFRRAVQFNDEALALFRAVGDYRGEADSLNNLAGAYDVLGDSRKALEYYEQALALVRKSGNRIPEAVALSNIGKLYHDLADWQRAVDYYRQSLLIVRAAGDQRREALTLHNIGVAYNSLGDSQKALEYFQQALPLRRAANDKAGEANTLDNIGYTYALSGEMRKALEYYNQALPLMRAAGDRLGEAFTLDHTGVALSNLGEYNKALDYHQQALQLRRAIEDRRGQAIALGNVGHVHTLLNQPSKAIEFESQALAMFQAIGDRQSQANMLQAIARAERDSGELTKARQRIESSLALIEAVRASVNSQQLRASYLASRQNAYQFYIDLLMQLHRQHPTEGHAAEALQASERARARSLLELLAEARVDIREGVDAALLARERDLSQQLNSKAQRLTQRNTAEQLSALNTEISALETEYQQVQGRIRRSSPHYAAITQPEPLGLKEIQQQILDKDTLLLEYSLGEERSYLWALTDNSITSYELPKREEIERAARRVYDLLTARSIYKKRETAPQKHERVAQADSQLPEAAAQLSRMTLSPVAAQLKNRKLIIVADGALQYVPFGALPAPQEMVAEKQKPVERNQTIPFAVPQPLIVEHEIVSLPSASTLAILRKEVNNRAPAPKLLAVFADPVFSDSDNRTKTSKAAVHEATPAQETTSTRLLEYIADKNQAGAATGGLMIPRLPFTRQEADRILAVAPGTANMKAVDFKASRATATDPMLGAYRYIHFATHGYLDSERPDLSAIVLSLVDEQGTPQNGFLRVNEVYNLKLPADLVVLSACQTGLGKEIKGEGLVGLTRGFMYAGAARVAVSLWSVSDKATAELMAKFYQKMLRENQRPSAALRAAQVEMWKQKQWRAPYYWAAFVLQGEW